MSTQAEYLGHGINLRVSRDKADKPMQLQALEGQRDVTHILLVQKWRCKNQ